MEPNATLQLASRGTGQGDRWAAVEIFGHAFLDVLKCDRGYAALVARTGQHIVEEFKFGNGAVDPKHGPVILEIISRQPQRAVVFESEWSGPIAEQVLGAPPAPDAQAVFGRICADTNNDLIFVSGWRTQTIGGGDLTLVRNSVGAIWTSIRRAADAGSLPASDSLIMKSAHPAFVVDPQMYVHTMNSAAQKMLADERILKLDKRQLLCLDASGGPKLKQAITDLLERNGEAESRSLVVQLSSAAFSLAFACVGVVPNALQGGRAIVIVPQLDEIAVTKRLSQIFALTGVEERIVVRVLEGHSQRRVGELLNLTEATVRTYTKRLMFKLNINRRSDLFRLAFLTTPPLALGTREATPVGTAGSGPGNAGEARFKFKDQFLARPGSPERKPVAAAGVQRRVARPDEVRRDPPPEIDD